MDEDVMKVKNYLASPSEAGKILGISRQGVHYRAKNGLIDHVKIGNRLFIKMDVSLDELEKAE